MAGDALSLTHTVSFSLSHTHTLLRPLSQDAHNSCPVCRFELPTDDMAYEQHKAREAAAAEERCGAANAVREGQFMYL